jgi:DNA-binding HxlR family transcriptional regulator
LEENIADITSSTLSTKLKKLVAEEIIIREQFDTIPPKVTYSMTKKGKDLKSLISQIESFSKKYY